MSYLKNNKNQNTQLFNIIKKIKYNYNLFFNNFMLCYYKSCGS